MLLRSCSHTLAHAACLSADKLNTTQHTCGVCIIRIGIVVWDLWLTLENGIETQTWDWDRCWSMGMRLLFKHKICDWYQRMGLKPKHGIETVVEAWVWAGTTSACQLNVATTVATKLQNLNPCLLTPVPTSLCATTGLSNYRNSLPHKHRTNKQACLYGRKTVTFNSFKEKKFSHYKILVTRSK